MLVACVSVIGLLAAIAAFTRALRDQLLYQAHLSELRQQLMMAENQLKHRSQLASEIAHDIKNPLTAILCSAEALDLLLKDSIDPDHRKSLTYIREYGNQLLRLLNDFLDLNRLHAGKIESVKEEVSALDACQSVVGLLQAYAEREEVGVRIVEARPETKVYIDPTHLKQILFNFIQNAIKFSFRGSQIIVAIDGRTHESYVVIEVSDSGVGISPERLRQLFNPYTHFEDPKLGKREGLGLGLALCQSLATLEKSKIDVQSELGKGTVFSLSVPRYVPPLSPIRELRRKVDAVTHRSSHEIFAGQTFLVVDQDQGVRDSVARLIESWGGIVDAANEVEAAIRSLSGKHYDAILLEQPDDGSTLAELTDKFKQSFPAQTTKIIVATHVPIGEGVGNLDGSSMQIEKPLNGKKILEALLPTQLQ